MTGGRLRRLGTLGRLATLACLAVLVVGLVGAQSAPLVAETLHAEADIPGGFDDDHTDLAARHVCLLRE